MKIDQLKVIQSVVETGSVKAAAERLNKTQPAISQALKAVEFQAGVQLFDRSGYRLELTPVGQRVYLQSLRVLTEAEDLTQLIRHFEKGNEEQITIALDDNTDFSRLLPSLRVVQDWFPDTRVVVRNEILSGTVNMIKDETADIAIAPMLPVMLEEDGLEHFRLYQGALINVAAPLLHTNLVNAKGIADLRRYHQVLVSDTGDASGVFDREFGVQTGQRRWYVGNLQAKKQLLLQGMGWGRLPSHLIADELAQGQLSEITLPLTHHDLSMEFFVFRKSELSLGPVAELLWSKLKSAK